MFEMFHRFALLLLASWSSQPSPVVLARIDRRAHAVATAIAVHYPVPAITSTDPDLIFRAGAHRIRWMRIDAALLASVDYAETGFGNAGQPWGACAMRLPNHSRICRHGCAECQHDVQLEDIVQWTLDVFEAARRICGREPVTVPLIRCWLTYHHSGSTSGASSDHFAGANAIRAWGLLAGRP